MISLKNSGLSTPRPNNLTPAKGVTSFMVEHGEGFGQGWNLWGVGNVNSWIGFVESGSGVGKKKDFPGKKL